MQTPVEYLITSNTMMLQPKVSNHASTQVWEDGHVFDVELKVQKILDDSCLEHGATFKGRREFASHYLMTDKKLPIAINPRSRVIMFPVRSIIPSEKLWITYHHIKTFCVTSTGNIEIIFTDNTTYTLDISKASFLRQYHLAARLVTRFT